MPKSITQKKKKRWKVISPYILQGNYKIYVKRFGEWLTRIRCRNHSSAFEITRALSLTLFLEVAVDSIIAMSSDSVG